MMQLQMYAQGGNIASLQSASSLGSVLQWAQDHKAATVGGITALATIGLFGAYQYYQKKTRAATIKDARRKSLLQALAPEKEKQKVVEAEETIILAIQKHKTKNKSEKALNFYHRLVDRIYNCAMQEVVSHPEIPLGIKLSVTTELRDCVFYGSPFLNIVLTINPIIHPKIGEFKKTLSEIYKDHYLCNINVQFINDTLKQEIPFPTLPLFVKKNQRKWM